MKKQNIVNLKETTEKRLEIVKKLAPKFTADEKDKTKLDYCFGIHYRKDGTAIVTEGHIILLVTSTHMPQKDSYTLHYKTGLKIAEGFYPDVDKVLPQTDVAVFFDLFVKGSLTSLVNAHKAAEAVSEVAFGDGYGDTIRPASYIIENGRAILQVKNPAKNETVFATTLYGTTQDNHRFHFNSRLMVTALQAFAAFKPIYITMNFKSNSTSSPVVITSDVGVTVVVTPVRMY